ncbi:hypothetical protein TREES_T100021579 [Tupaia chinensis]|uniref:Uncharacterized protein n=1 Tax=Tupaia chinensis TaxID=246437 RepID=L9K5G3_TUPCH|nr:hypothetical protein TREES_T100021579 [Tupaia chinensis]
MERIMVVQASWEGWWIRLQALSDGGQSWVQETATARDNEAAAENVAHKTHLRRQRWQSGAAADLGTRGRFVLSEDSVELSKSAGVTKGISLRPSADSWLFLLAHLLISARSSLLAETKCPSVAKGQSGIP